MTIEEYEQGMQAAGVERGAFSAGFKYDWNPAISHEAPVDYSVPMKTTAQGIGLDTGDLTHLNPQPKYEKRGGRKPPPPPLRPTNWERRIKG